jgi:hypothetical protein
MPNESATWLSTSALVGSKPEARITTAGVMVMARRSQTGIRRFRKPSMMICPAAVPTLDDEIPEASSAAAKARAAVPPTVSASLLWTS